MRVTFLAAAVALAADQLSKFYILSVLQLDRAGGIDVIPPWVNFRMGWNRGVNFGLLSGDSEVLRWSLIALSLAVAGFILFWSLQRLPGRVEQAFSGALAGGAAGNAVDRIVHGAVVDFLNMSCCGIDNPFVFNLADVAIVGGAAGLALRSMSVSAKG